MGRREQGRPKRRMKDCYADDAKEVGANARDALDTRKWRRKTHTGDPHQWTSQEKKKVIDLEQGWADFSAQGPESQILSFRGPHSKLPRLFQNY